MPSTLDLADARTRRFRAPVTLAPGDDNTTASFSLLARTPDPIDHWYWGRMVHDFAGMVHKNRIPIDWCHDNEEAIGYADRISVTDAGLVVEGELVSVREDDRASDVIAKARGGIPFEASIEFHLDGLQIEELGPAEEAEVNGKTFSGPLVIFRKWKLAAVAIVPFGADPGTEATILRRRDPMPTHATTQLAQQTPDQPQTPPEHESATDQDDHRAQLRRYLERFGAENGAQWFADGLSYHDAIEKHVDELEQQLQAAEDAIAELKHQLSAVRLGEEDPLAAADHGAKPKGLASLINIRR